MRAKLFNDLFQHRFSRRICLLDLCQFLQPGHAPQSGFRRRVFVCLFDLNRLIVPPMVSGRAGPDERHAGRVQLGVGILAIWTHRARRGSKREPDGEDLASVDDGDAVRVDRDACTACDNHRR